MLNPRELSCDGLPAKM